MKSAAFLIAAEQHHRGIRAIAAFEGRVEDGGLAVFNELTKEA
jgi:hypothetical protein